MSEPEGTGDDRDVQLVNGMRISARIRRDFIVTNSDQLLASARLAHRQLHPGTTEQDAAEFVTCAADAIFTLLEQAGISGDAADAALAANEDKGLSLGGVREQVTFNDSHPLLRDQRCGFGEPEEYDAFSLPSIS